MYYEVSARLVDSKTPHGGAKAAEREAIDFFLSIRREVTAEIRGLMRQGISGVIGDLSERESVITTVSPSPPSLRSSSSLIKAKVDEGGRLPGGLPPFGPGSTLREWVIGVLAPDAKQEYVVARGVAFRIMERGLPRPGDPLRAPFATAFRNMLPAINDGLLNAGERAIQSVNSRFDI